MLERYSSRTIALNDYEIYKEIINKRNLNFINHYSTPNFIFPKYEQVQDLNLVEHIWTLGDRFYKLSYKYYGDSRDWWVIAKFNNTPTESHVKLGDIIFIPTPLEKVLSVLKG